MKHPAKSENEIFVGNQVGSEIQEIFTSLTTMRTGVPAYTIDGEVIPNMVALFIDRSEANALNEIQMTRTFGSRWRNTCYR